MFKLRRLSEQPILTPLPEHPWERAAVFNCGVTMPGSGSYDLPGLRCRDFQVLGHTEPSENHKFYSSFGLAVSADGLNFTREKDHFPGRGGTGSLGCGRPRLSKIGDTYYMVYTSFGGRSWDDHKISLASSRICAPGSATSAPG